MKTVLIVEDDLKQLNVYKKWLLKADFRCVESNNGEDALVKISNEKFDLILSDIMMPKINGFDICREVRLGDINRDTPIVLLSSMTSEREIEHGTNQGANDYLTKPISSHLLIAKVKSLIDSYEKIKNINPLSGLPGNLNIKEHCEYMLHSHQDFAISYFDIDNFKAYNDTYGFDSGDIVIKDLARVLEVCKKGIKAFIGHIGGDDFIVVLSPQDAYTYSAKAVEMFAKRIPDYYNKKHNEIGHIESKDRTGLFTKIPLMDVSVGITSTPNHPGSNYHELTGYAAECKSMAKKNPDKIYLDGRSN